MSAHPKVAIEGRLQKADREDAYVDTGCEYSPACLTCPLPVCKHDDQNAHQQLEYDFLRALHRRGMPRKRIVTVMGVSHRTVDRALARL